MTPTQAEAIANTSDISDVSNDTAQREKKKKAKRKARAAAAPDAPGRGNPRFIVTSAGKKTHAARALYEDFYCARGEMENRIKKCQLDLFADRASCAAMRANQLRRSPSGDKDSSRAGSAFRDRDQPLLSASRISARANCTPTRSPGYEQPL